MNSEHFSAAKTAMPRPLPAPPPRRPRDGIWGGNGTTTVPAAPPGKRSSIWRNHDFVLLWSGQIVSTLGSQISGITFPLLILALTNSPEVAGITGALFTLPYVILSLPAGALVDRWDRKRVMIVCDAVRALNMASIPMALLLNALTVWQIYLVALIEGSMFVFFNVAEVAALPRVVSREHLAEASSQNQAAQATAALIGPSVGGFLFQSVSRGFPFLVDAVSYAVSVVSLFFIKTEFQLDRSPRQGNLWGEIVEGAGVAVAAFGRALHRLHHGRGQLRFCCQCVAHNRVGEEHGRRRRGNRRYLQRERHRRHCGRADRRAYPEALHVRASDHRLPGVVGSGLSVLPLHPICSRSVPFPPSSF